MAATYTGAGGIFTYLGKHIAWFNQLRQYASGSAFSSAAGDISKGLDQLHSSGASAFLSSLDERKHWDKADTVLEQQKAQLEAMQDAARTVINDCMTGLVRNNLDGPKGLNASQVAELLAQQMSADTQKVKKNSVTVSSVSAAASNVGPARIYVKLTDVSGVANELALANKYRVTVENDDLNGATLGQERLKLAMETSEAGEAKSITFQPHYAEKTRGNRIPNGGFDSASAALPSGWNLISGTTGKVSLVSAAANVFVGSKSLQFSGDGSTTYTLNVTVGASALSTPMKATDHLLGMDIKTETSHASVVTLKLVGTGWSSSAITVSADLSSFTDQTLWVPLPKNVPSDMVLRLKCSGLASTKHVWVDNLSLGEAYGPLRGVKVAARHADTERRIGDRFDFSTTNNHGGVIQTYFTRDSHWNNGKGVRLPSTATASIADSLAT